MLLPTTSHNHNALKTYDEVNTYSHLIKHLTTDKDARKLTILLIINLVCAILEVIYGFLSNSIGLLSDSAHMLFDSTALAVGIYASYKATLPANSKFSYGFDRFQTLSGLINGIFLIFIGFYIFIESLERIYNPPVIQSQKMIVVAVIGLVVNVVGVTFFHEHAHFGDSDEHSGCSHSHGHSDQKAHKHQPNQAKVHAEHHHGHSHAHSHSHSHHSHDHSETASSINHLEQSTTSLTSTVNSIKGEEEHHSHDHHHNCNHDHHHEHDHHHHHDHKAHAHAHDHHDHDHHHDHDEHEEHDHDHGHDHSHNENLAGVFLHILADLLGSVGVITSSILIIYFDWYIADAICSAITSLLILASVIPLIKSSVMVFLQTYPAKYKKTFHQALSDISSHPAVVECKDPHLWQYANGKLVCSLILIVKQNTADTNNVIEFARKKLKIIKKIEYMTIDCRTEGQN